MYDVFVKKSHKIHSNTKTVINVVSHTMCARKVIKLLEKGNSKRLLPKGLSKNKCFVSLCCYYCLIYYLYKHLSFGTHKALFDHKSLKRERPREMSTEIQISRQQRDFKVSCKSQFKNKWFASFR